MYFPNKRAISVCLLINFLLVGSCSKELLNKQPLGPTNSETLANGSGVNGLLIGAYSMLDGWGGAALGGNPYAEAVSNWSFGGVCSDDAHKGSTDDDGPDVARLENFTFQPTNPFFNGKWGALYDGVQRANTVINMLPKVVDGSLSNKQKTEIMAEAVFLRAFFLFQAAKIWRNVPYIGEKNTFENNSYDVPNTIPIWPKIEKDFQFAIDNLPPTQQEVGRVNSWAAKAFLAKVYMFEHKYQLASNLLTDIVKNGVTSSGQKYSLLPNFTNNFNPADKNTAEAVFSVQMTVHDGSNGETGNPGDILNYPDGAGTSCCGWYQPSFSLVNSFKTDSVTGLPLLDTWNDSDMKNDQGISSSTPFTPYAGTVDPRLDWTIGRRGIPFLDFGIMPGQAWVRDQAQGGCYLYKKDIPLKSQYGTYTETAFGWAPNQATAINYEVIRFSGVLLLAAEADVELGNLSQAEEYVNRVRARAANPTYWVHTYKSPNDPSQGFTNTPAADYKIGLYPPGYFEQKGQDYARKAVRFERKLELAMEGHRFFDLQRWDNGTGYMAKVMNAYFHHEANVRGFESGIITNSTKFVQGKNEIFPIPQAQIDLSVRNGVPILKQNPGY